MKTLKLFSETVEWARVHGSSISGVVPLALIRKLARFRVQEAVEKDAKWM